MKKIVALSLVAVSLLVAADEKSENPFVTHTELSYMNTQGNSDVETFAASFDGKKNYGDKAQHKTTYKVTAQYTDDTGTTSAQKYLAEANYGYSFTSALSAEYILGFKQDWFSSFEYQGYTGPGMGYQAVSNDKVVLDTNAYVMYANDGIATSVDADGYVLSSVRDQYISVRVGGKLTWQMIENLKFIEEANYRTSTEDFTNYFVFSKTAFEAKVSDNLSAGVSYTVDYTNLPANPAGADAKLRLDTTFLASLIIDY